MSGIGYLAIGYGVVWLLVAAYLIWLAHRQRLIQRRLDSIEGQYSSDSQG